MAPQRISLAKQRSIARLAAKGLSNRSIASELNLHDTTVMRYRNGVAPVAMAAAGPEQIESGIRASLKRAPMSAAELAHEVDSTAANVRSLIQEMAARGVLIVKLPGGKYDLASTASLAPGRFELTASPGVETLYGVTSDNHLCSKYSRLDVLNAAYKRFAARGIQHVFNAGNMIDGEARFNKTELLTAPGMDNQIDYLIDKWPVYPGIMTHFIAGDDHEGWYAQREGIEIGRYMEARAIAAGRTDLHYLGYAEADVSLRCGSGSSVARIVHPGGGSSYAISYTTQKLVESYQGGEKPRILIAGHYHKFEHGFPREVDCVQPGCTQDQSLFMRKKKLAAHVGFVEISVTQDSRGIVTDFGAKFSNFYDRGFYEKRYK